MEAEEDDDLEFETLVKEFTTDISTGEYVNFFENVPPSEPMINEFEIDWWQRVRIQKLQVIRSKRFPIMTGAMTRMTS